MTPKEQKEYHAAMWRMKPSEAGWVIEAIEDSLPTAANVGLWKHDPAKRRCPLCNSLQTLKHTISGPCPPAMDQGRWTWRHNKVLEHIVAGLRKAHPNDTVWADLPYDANGPPMPPCVADSIMAMRPDIVMVTATKIAVIELTCPFEDNFDKAHNFKMTKYRALPFMYSDVAKLPVELICVEVGARGRLAPSFRHLDKLLGPETKETRSNCIRTAIACSQTLFFRRNEPVWSTLDQTLEAA